MNLVRPHAGGNAPNPCITIVESDIALALALSDNLKTEGYVVESVDHGEEAVRKLADAPPDLVILDWMLAGMSGPEICTRLRADNATRMLPIIMLSARGACRLCCDVAGLLWPPTFLFAATFNSITRLEGSAGARATFVSVRRSSGCSNVCLSDLAASFHGSSFWSAPGSDPLTSRIEP